MNINLILILFAIFWLITLTVFVVWFFMQVKSLYKDSKNKDFIKTLKEIEEIQSKNLKDILDLKLDLDRFKKDSKFDIQKVGLAKYNPFNESGGDHSFSLALLDGNKNGIIITSLHTRERTRLYVKEILLGKSKLELSKDEEKALKLSLK